MSLTADLVSLNRDRRLRRDLESLERGKPEWTILTHGHRNWSIPVICTITPVCGSRHLIFTLVYRAVGSGFFLSPLLDGRGGETR
jgi:hypothetical protein